MNWQTALWSDGSPDWPRVLLVGLVLMIAVTAGVASATSGTAFGPYNPSWDGASDLRTQIDGQSGFTSEFLTDTDRYQSMNATDTTVFVIAPDERYRAAETDQIRQFLAAGGRMVVMDNFGTASNELLADLGAEARVNGSLLRDEENFYEAPTLPVATGVDNRTLTAGVDQLTLNFATSVEPGNATVLVRTSEFAYLAASADDELDDDDELAAYPVAAVETVANGQVVTVGDPSLTINAMLDQPDNTVFLSNLYADTDRVLFDLTHSNGLPPLTRILLVVRGSAVVQAVFGGGLLLGAAVLGRRRVTPALEWVQRRSPVGSATESVTTPALRADSDWQAAYLRRQHPDWDEERIRRVTQALNNCSGNPEKKER